MSQIRLFFQKTPVSFQTVTNGTLRERVSELVQAQPFGSARSLERELEASGHEVTKRHVARVLNDVFAVEAITELDGVVDHKGQPLNPLLIEPFLSDIRRKGTALLIAQLVKVGNATLVLANDLRGSRVWAHLADEDHIDQALSLLREATGAPIVVVPHGTLRTLVTNPEPAAGVAVVDYLHAPLPYRGNTNAPSASHDHPHLDQLEAESIRIIREAVAAAKRPGMLFSMGKDSMVMWTLAVKAFWPEPPPFPLAVIDTRWKFREMYEFRSYMENLPETDVSVHINPEAIERDMNPFDFGSATHTDITKTQALKQVLDHHQFDFVFGGARRDEERSRAKERVFSIRNAKHGWDPKSQRPELWNLYNTALPKGQSMRVFPLSNWTELDVWRYIEREHIPVVPLYFSRTRPFVERDGALIMVDDERFRLEPGEKVRFEQLRFRTLGCYPLTGGVRSTAQSVSDIISELEESRVSERSSRVIDFDPGASMEQKKKEGYF
jgi:sulfate adenylyltransferase subunit 2